MSHAERVRRLEHQPVGRLLWEYSLPAIAATVGSAAHGVINRIFVGQMFDDVGLAAITVTFPFITIMLAVGMTIGIGSNTLISIRLGEKKNEEAEKIVGQALFLFGLFGIGFMAFGLLFQEPLLKLLGTSDRVMPAARQYLTIMVCGAFFHEISFGANSFLRSEGRTHIAMFTTLIMVILNIFFDYLFLIVLRTDVWGAALATVLAQICSTSWVFWHYIFGSTLLRWRLKNIRWNGALAKEVVRLGMPPFIMQVVACFIQILQVRQIAYYGERYGSQHGFEHGGDVALSVFGILFVVWMVTVFPILGINQGAQPIIGYNLGAGKFNRVAKALQLAIYYVLGVTLVFTAVLMIFPEVLLQPFISGKNSEAMLILACWATRIACCCLAAAGVTIVVSGYYQAIGNARMAIVLTLLRQVVVLVPMLLVMPHVVPYMGGLGLDGIWIAIPISDFAAMVISLVLLKRELARLKKQEAKRSGQQCGGEFPLNILTPNP
jgi:putative MATE family efflux protein